MISAIIGYVWLNEKEEPQSRTISLLKRTSTHIAVEITKKSVFQLKKQGWRCVKANISFNEIPL